VEASPEGKKLDHQAQVLDSIPFSDKTRKLENHEYVLNLKKDSLISDIYMKSSGRKLTLDQEFNYYDGTASGIYIFKPQKDKEKFEYRVSSSQVFQGKLVSVVRTASEGHFSQQIVVFHSGDTEIAPLVATTAQSWGYKEVGFSLKTNPSGSKTFYNHDSNEFVKREFEKIEDISESGRNIYPSVHGFAVKDKTSFFGIVNNYPTGCGFTSNAKNDVQCFLMRNTMMDDDKGLPDYLIDTQKVTFKYFIMLEKGIKEYSKRFRTLSDYFNLPVTTNYSDEDRADDAVISEITEDPDTYYESFMKWMFEETEITPEPEQELYTPILKPGNATSFTILHNKDLPEDIEILDLFENYKGKLFVRIRNRDLKESLGEKLKAKDQKIDLKDTFVFKLSAEHKYTLNGLKKHKMMPKPEEGNIVQKTLKLIDKGIKYIKGEEFRHQCLKDGKALLKPREIATFKIET